MKTVSAKSCNLIITLMFFLFMLNNCKKKEASVTTLKVGDPYQGGYVAYILQSSDQGYVAGEIHGLIVAKSDQDTAAEWGCYGTWINEANGSKIGTGTQNTKAIMDSCITTHIAARICGNLKSGGYDDWYLPSKDELNKLYESRTEMDIFNTKAGYWSSTQCDDKGAWKLVFPDGKMVCYGKLSPNYVRAVRSF